MEKRSGNLLRRDARARGDDVYLEKENMCESAGVFCAPVAERKSNDPINNFFRRRRACKPLCCELMEIVDFKVRELFRCRGGERGREGKKKEKFLLMSPHCRDYVVE